MALIKESLERSRLTFSRISNFVFSNSRTPVKPLALGAFKEVFDPQLKKYLNKKEADLSSISENKIIVDGVKHSVTIILSGGKRVRPYMIYLAYLTSGARLDNRVFRSGIAIELLHSFALIHDDIIDHGLERHGLPTVHTYLSSVLAGHPRGNKSQIGQSLALLVGDVIFNWSYEAILSGANKRAVDIYTRMIDEVVVGQMIDVTLALTYDVLGEDIAEKNELKTARYSFVNPMLIGQALAGRHDQTDFYTNLGLLLGQAFQIQDDILDVIGESHKTGKHNFSDVSEGQHTFLSQHIMTGEDVTARDLLLSLFGKDLDNQSKEALRRLFVDSGAVDQARLRANDLISEAQELVSSQAMNEEVREVWLDFIKLLKKRSN